MPASFLSRSDVEELGQALIRISDRYPLAIRTERDFFPLVEAYLDGRFPKTSTEVAHSRQKIDFRVGGTNPVLLELAVAPRALKDPRDESLHIPGHGYATQLYAVNNRSELEKLARVPQKQAKARYLLLLDLQGNHNASTLEAGYKARLLADSGHASVQVIYSCHEASGCRSFSIGGRKKGKRRTRAA